MTRMPIRLLPDEVASQIAAGEVIERPASVVKELIENALDAGASTISVEVAGAGKRLIRVADDGAGIPAAEVELAFARHATSKLASAADLFHITTLGFRGEALASIGSVSQVTLLSRSRDETLGVQIRVEGGEVRRRSAAGAPPGTLVTVENLFYNVPARLKFLKADVTEKRQIDALVSRYALAYPRVRFSLTHDGREAFRSHGNGDLREALAGVFGVEVARQMIEVGDSRPEAGGLRPSAPNVRQSDSSVQRPTPSVQVTGFVTPPTITRGNRREITLFVNGRWVQDQKLTAAVLQAYHSLLMAGKYPMAVLLLRVPPDEMDVNVHPAKSEVRFRDANAAFSAVERAVRSALLAHAPVKSVSPSGDWGDAGWQERRQALMGGNWRTEAAVAPSPIYPRPEPGDLPPSETPNSGLAGDSDPSASALPLPIGSPMPLLRLIGQVGAAYLVAEGPDGLYLIDQHAAHERVLYEEWMAGMTAGALASQALLEAVPVEVPPESARVLEDQLEALGRLGFGVEHFGGNTFLVRRLPALLAHADPAAALRVVVEDFEEDETPLAAQAEARLIARVCKRAAVKAGQVLSAPEQLELVRKLETCRSPRTCPHGRPTMIHLSVATLERQFGRKG